MNDKQHIVRIATDVRTTFVSKVVPALLEMNLVECAGSCDPKSLEGYCGYASVMLYNRLKNEGFFTRIVHSDEHWFIKCDRFLVDITASQFGQGMVCVRDWESTQKKVNSGKYALAFWKYKGDDDIKAMADFDLAIERALTVEE